GSTAPDASFTVPATLPSPCAVPTPGTLTSPQARSRIGAYCRRTLRITVLRVVMESCGGFSLCEPLFPERRTYTPPTKPCQGWWPQVHERFIFPSVTYYRGTFTCEVRSSRLPCSCCGYFPPKRS